MVNRYPFTENGNIRIFSADTDPSQLQWHWDEEDRRIEVIKLTDWLIQFDNELPIIFEDVFIPAGTYHRLIKGSRELHLRITKL